MGKLTAFNFLTINGYYKGLNDDISWHKHGSEEGEYSKEALKSESVLLFGRVTYEMMKSYWPTPDAIKNNPEVARGMNNSEKIVFSKTLKKTDWNNSRIINANIVDEVRKLKKSSPKNMTILGSGSILSLFASEGIIDGYQFMIDPVAINGGTPVFKELNRKLDLKLTDTRIFRSGVVLLCYEPIKFLMSS